jgi:hypothetical protein
MSMAPVPLPGHRQPRRGNGQPFQRFGKNLGGQVFDLGSITYPAVEITVDRRHVAPGLAG